MSDNEITTNTTASGGFMNVSSLEQALECSKYIANSSFCPKGFAGKPGDVLICLQMGQELGLKPMQALQNIAVINGKPSLWGDAMPAVCRQSGEFEYMNETYTDSPDDKIKGYTCIVKRRNEPEYVYTFTVAKAKTAQLWGKPGPWTNFPERMLQMRARGFCLRDAFPDLLRGIISDDEAQDTPYTETDYSNKKSQVFEGEIVYKDLITEEQIKIVREKMVAADVDEKTICSFLKIAAIELMLAESYPKVISKLEKSIAKVSIEKTSNAEVDDFFAVADSEEIEVKTQAEQLAERL